MEFTAYEGEMMKDIIKAIWHIPAALRLEYSSWRHKLYRA